MPHPRPSNELGAKRPVDLSQFSTASDLLLRKRSLLSRREDKFILSLEALPSFLAAMPSHYHVLRAAGEAGLTYETLYLDSDDLPLLELGHALSARSKIRIRRYPSRGLCYLEVKSRDISGLTTKHRLLRGNCAPVLETRDWNFIRTHVPQVRDDIRPQVCVRYRRLSFLSLLSQERLTVDLQLHYWEDDREEWLQEAAVVEVKRPPNGAPSQAIRWLAKNQIAVSQFSKYRTGLWLRGHLPPPPQVDLRLWRLVLVSPRGS